jgi:uncharacterized protein (TIGR03435 family)
MRPGLNAAFGILLCVAATVGAGQRPAFDVASVKLNKSGPGSPQRVGLPPGDRVSLTNVPVRTLILVAYPDVFDIVGSPAWIGVPGPNFDVERFDVIAKADKPGTSDELRAMLRNLLADRFKLAVHMEVRAEPIWALVLARRDGKLGPNLRPAATTCAALREAAQPIEKGNDPCGTRSFATALMTGRMSVRGFTIDQLGIVTNDLDRRRVVNKTGLFGAFDWDLAWTPQRFLQGSFDRDRFPTIDPDGPSIFTALDEQLGLTLESQKGETAVLVIDHVEHPTED